MYALPNKTQHKLIAKVRGGISQKLDNLNTTTSVAATPTISTTNSSICSSPTAASTTTISTSFDSGCVNNNNSNNDNREFSLLKSTSPFNSKTATILSKESQTTINRFNIDEAIFDPESKNCLPQPVFHHTNHGTTSKQKFSRAQKQQCITPEHNEMIKYVQQSWKGVERDYKKSVNNYTNIDITNGSNNDNNISLKQSSKTSPVTNDHHQQQQQQNQLKQKQGNGKKKTPTTSTPLLLTGSYHHTSITKDSNENNRQDSFRPFDLETFWGNRILQRLTQDL